MRRGPLGLHGSGLLDDLAGEELGEAVDGGDDAGGDGLGEGVVDDSAQAFLAQFGAFVEVVAF